MNGKAQAERNNLMPSTEACKHGDDKRERNPFSFPRDRQEKRLERAFLLVFDYCMAREGKRERERLTIATLPRHESESLDGHK